MVGGLIVITISEEEKEQAWLRSREKHILDYKSNPAYAEQVGHAKGRAEGLSEGMAFGRLRIARNALAEGAFVEFVQKITGLDMEIIKNIHTVRVKSEKTVLMCKHHQHLVYLRAEGILGESDTIACTPVKSSCNLRKSIR
jgi:hypothetical protein